jgi:hypothetical protein
MTPDTLGAGMDDHRREIATRLAGSLGDGAALPLLQLLHDGTPLTDWRSAAQGLGPFASLAEDALGMMVTSASGRPRVGIWELDPSSGEWIRSRAHVDLWHFCADVERIPRKGSRKRVVFLGESVARGFFFDPFYSPARVLETLLSTTGEAVEVIDLAQSNLDPWSLSVVASSAALLEPDAIVVFAGNNWRTGPLASRSSESCAVDGALLASDGGFEKLLERQRSALESLASRTVQQLAMTAEDAGVPLVLVIPDLNVSDWTSCTAGMLDLPLMSDADTRDWVRAYSAAVRALSEGAFSDAERAAGEAVALDRGVSAASLDALADAQLALGYHAASAETRRRSRDLTLGFLDGTRPVPGIFSCVADTMRRVGVECGATVVDLREIFGGWGSTPATSGPLFLDYCHLSAAGIRVAMAATAAALTKTAEPSSVPLVDCLDAAPAPSPEQEGWAHLMAAIHNAHWGQTLATCEQHLRRALACHPPLRNTALPLVYETFRRGIPPALLASYDSLVRHPVAAVYLLGYGHNLRTEVVSESRLVETIIAVEPSLGTGCLDPDFCLGDISEIDLLGSHWRELTDANRWYNRAFTAAYHPQSAFTFHADRPRRVTVTFTCRIPGALEQGHVSIECNGSVISSFSAGNGWHSAKADVDPPNVLAGANQLLIRWPVPRRQDERPRLRTAFEAGRPLDLRTHFGHLHHLRLSVA